jgi:ABC-type oligopeptide transport system substrate-binding subunit
MRTRRRGRRRAAGRIALAVLVVATAACNRSGGDKKTPAAAFRAAVVRPATLDPAQARTVDELLIADQLFDTLSAHDPATHEPAPALAASWTASEDQQHWDFTLRPGAVFSDGSAITSADVKATLERIARKDSKSSVSDLLELVTGYAAVAVDGSTTDLAGVLAPSPNIVHVDLDQPWSLLPSALANPAFGVVPASLAAPGATFPDGPPVGSGPFKVVQRSATSIELAVSGGARTKSKRIEFRLFDDKAASYEAFKARQVDWSEVPADRVVEAGARYGNRLFRSYVAELFYAFNLHNPKFADLRVREAIVRAVDRDAIVKKVYAETVKPLSGLLVDGLGGQQEGVCPLCGHDPERAKALVAAVAAEGRAFPELQIDFEDDKTQTAVATAIRDDLSAVGITATLRPKSLADYQQFAVSGEQELFRLGWIAPYPSADAILTPLFETGVPNNLTGYSSAAVDDRLRAARAANTPAARSEAFRAAERAVLADLPILPIAQFHLQSVASSRVRGLDVTATGTFDGRNVWVAATG